MRVFLVAAVLCGSLTTMDAAFGQNELPQGEAAGQAPQGQAPGTTATPAKRAPGQPVAGQPAVPPGGANNAEFLAQVSYALGRNFAMNLKDSGIAVDMKSLMAGVNDTLTGAKPKWTDEQCNLALQKFGQEMQQREQSRLEGEAMKNQQQETQFLAQNSKREGVQTTPSGLQYRVIQQGQGASPTINDVVKCNYRGTLINGTEFDASSRHGGPAEFPVRGVIPGWTEALQKMHVGDKWQLFVPAKLAYGMNPPGPPIEAGSTLVFDIELLDIVKQ